MRGPATTLSLVIVVMLGVACGDASQKSAVLDAPARGSTQSGSAGPAMPGRGLLVPRDQRLAVRNMANGTEKMLIRAPASVFYAYPRWSPDGAQIAYTLKTAFNGTPNQDWGDDLAVNTPDGANERVVLKRPQIGTTIEGLAWLPDGSGFYAGILETTIRDNRFIGQSSRIERIDLATGARTTIINEAGYPTVTPDGSRIAYVTNGNGDTPGGLWTAKPDGTDQQLIVRSAGQFVTVSQPRFSPNGASIAFSAVPAFAYEPRSEPAAAPRRAGRWPWQPAIALAHGLPQDVWSIPAAGGEPIRLTKLLEDEPAVAWAPDGTKLAIVASGGLYEMLAAGGSPRKVGVGGTSVQIDWR